MSSSLPDGATLRAATEDDAEAVTAVYHAAEAALRGRSLWDVGDLRSWWRLANLETDTWLVHDGDRLVAAATLVPHGEAAELGWAILPERQSDGLATTLLDLAERRSRDGGFRLFRGLVYAEDDASVALLTARGHRDARHYYTMRIDLGGEREAPVWPDGIAPGTVELHEARAFHAALQESFAEEWGWSPLPFEEWHRLRVEVPEFDPKLWFVARDDRDLAAVARCERGYGGGWVAALGVRPPWRRRGLGRALLLEAFAEFERRGERSVRLGVDARNPTGALRLYQSVGMHVEFEDVVYEKELR